ncbi:MAG: hypothetical protein GTO55_10815 [Armatimonadetes bacterium]|nr:hypothetical protein [Armatimonadota bacterium]NIM24722.1 hypothetical protein [Armatimonadota bacterium]NIM68602.1 hypothetical protein [Armatimonadota bacterium]NIM77119.1 hypothetical protein [Armatimonadota bacterium]NIN06796.1 hypothetical protein [Armatimonadota bacterium]
MKSTRMQALLVFLLSAVVSLTIGTLSASAMGCSTKDADGSSMTSHDGCSMMSSGGKHEHHKAAKDACPVCKKPLGKKPVTFKYAGKTISYRCIHCALVDSKNQGDGVIVTHSAITGKEISLEKKVEKKGMQWKATPKTAVALILSEKGDDCLAIHQVFSSRAEFDSYIKSHPDIAKQKPRPLLLTDVDAIIKAGMPPLPAQATCPVTKRVFKPTKDTVWEFKDGTIQYFCCPECKMTSAK